MSTPSETPMVDAMVRTTTIESRHPLPPHHREFRDLEYVSVEDARKIENKLIEANRLIYLLEETPENFAELLEERDQLRARVAELEKAVGAANRMIHRKYQSGDEELILAAMKGQQ